ncbi:MAG TPA: hypothetical protein V6C84_07740 [Coleofasciculaceae cyanobacterium]|jgi:hypothetical protein
MNPDSRTSQPLFEGESSVPPEVLACNGLNLFPWQNGSSGLVIPDFTTIQNPQYSLGTRCRWILTLQTDWGTVIGQIYAPDLNNSHEISQWSWLYLLLLDLDSPSRSWVVADWVDEKDLELLPSEQLPSLSEDDQEAL